MNPRREEFERLALPLQNDLYFAARALDRREADALDLVQETLLKAYRSFGLFNRGDNFKAWIFTILRNAYLDRCRRNRRQPVPLVPGDEPSPAPDGSALPLEELLPERLLRALRALSPAHQILVLLRDIEGLSYRQIADVLGCPLGSVMSGLHNARGRLKSFLSARDENQPRSHRATETDADA